MHFIVCTAPPPLLWLSWWIHEEVASAWIPKAFLTGALEPPQV